MTDSLHWDVLVSSHPLVVTTDLPPGATERRWSPISATLISGRQDAVLVDTFLTLEQNRQLVEWIEKSGKKLTAIYATHGHGDHFFGVNTIRRTFPNARFVATRDVIDVMRRQTAPAVFEPFWNSRFPGQIDTSPVLAEELAGMTIDLEGADLVSIPLGHTDTDNTTCLHVPSVGLVVAGDAAYNDVHLFLGESTAATRKEWIAALGTIESLRPRAVIAGHKKPGNDDSPGIIEETRQYIRDFDRAAANTASAEELYHQMLELYPDRLNPGALWSSARGVKG